MKRIALVSFIALVQTVSAQVKSEYTVAMVPSKAALNDTAVYRPEIKWAIAVANYLDVREPDTNIRQTINENITKNLVRSIFKKELNAYPTYAYNRYDNFFLPLIIEDGFLKDPYLIENPYDTLNEGSLQWVDAENYPNAYSGYFVLIQNIYWSDIEKRLLSKITYAGIADWFPYTYKKWYPWFYAMVNSPEQPHKKRKPIWEAEHYFEQTFAAENVPLLKQVLNQDLAQVMWESVRNGDVVIRDTDGITPLNLDSLQNRCLSPDTLRFIRTRTLDEMVAIKPVFNSSRLTYFGILQHITIYDDWTAEAEIKGLKIFTPAVEQDNKTQTPAGWIYFRMDD